MNREMHNASTRAKFENQAIRNHVVRRPNMRLYSISIDALAVVIERL